MTTLLLRRVRDVVVVLSAVLLVNGCHLTDATELSRLGADSSRPSASNALADSVADAGCSLGLSEGPRAARVEVVPRSRLPFSLPSVGAVLRAGRPVRMHVVRIAVPAGGARPSAILACLLPANGNYVQRAVASVQQTRVSDWVALAQDLVDNGVLIQHDIYRAVAEGLLAATFHIGSASSVVVASRLMRPPGAMWLPTGDPYPLPTVVVTADANVVVFDTYVVRALFSSGESPIVTWEMQVAQQQWSQDCAAWNAAMDEYDATKDAVAATANEEANELDALADQIESGLPSLETSDASCRPTNGKRTCIDFFIMNCWILGMGGDCRDFDRNAGYGSSRVQLYLDPVTRVWEVKYNCSSMYNPLNSPPFTIACDSAKVFDPSRDVHTFAPDAAGWTEIDMSFSNNFCLYVGNSVCPSITASVKFRPNASAPGGYEIQFIRDGFPSMGVYVRNGTDTDWLVAKEDAQKTRSGVNAIRALAGQIRSQGYNYPPPGDQPPGCFRQ